MSLPEEERRKKFKWARNSEESKTVRKMEEELCEKINALSELATEAKKKKKINKYQKTMEVPSMKEWRHTIIKLKYGILTNSMTLIPKIKV